MSLGKDSEEYNLTLSVNSITDVELSNRDNDASLSDGDNEADLSDGNNDASLSDGDNEADLSDEDNDAPLHHTEPHEQWKLRISVQHKQFLQ